MPSSYVLRPARLDRLGAGPRLTDAVTGADVPWPDTHVLLAARRVV